MRLAASIGLAVVACAVAAGCCRQRASSGDGGGVTSAGATTAAPTACPGDPGGPANAPGPTFVELAAGADHTCAILPSREVACWGANGFGQLGAAGPVAPGVAVRVTGVCDAVDVATGMGGSCAVLEGGTVWCWGLDTFAGRGLATSGRPNAAPEAVRDLDDATQVAVGTNVACAVRAGGTIACWGRGANPILGDEHTVSGALPTPVPGVRGAVQIAMGGRFACARLQGGSVACWGEAVDPAGLTGVSALAASEDRVCAVRAGAIDCWRPSSTPIALERVAGLADAVTISMGPAHICATRRGGAVRCWGRGDRGQLGGGTAAVVVTTPVEVAATGGARQVAAGSAHTCALLEPGTALCWGANDAGQLGAPTETELAADRPLCAIADATQVAAGRAHTCVLRRAGRIACVGANDHGQLGLPPSLPVRIPTDVAGIDDAVAVAAGVDHACALRRSGAVVCWGANQAGQINGRPGGTAGPTGVTLPASAVEIAAGPTHTCARLEGGRVACWGENAASKLDGRDGLLGAGSEPALVPGVDSATQLAALPHGSCALRAGGRAVCWGPAFVPEPSPPRRGGTPERPEFVSDRPPDRAPRVLSQADGASALGAGRFAVCAAIAGGVRCSSSGRDVASPVATRAIAIVVGDEHACALLDDRSVQCWGASSRARLAAPAKPMAGDQVDGLAAGARHTCAVHASGIVRCWGENAHGQLGTGTTGDAHRPVQVTAVPR